MEKIFKVLLLKQLNIDVVSQVKKYLKQILNMVLIIVV